MILASSRTRTDSDLTRTVATRRVTPTAAWIALGVAAVSVAAPLIRLAGAPALVVALYRNLVALAVLAPAALVLHPGDLRRLFRSASRAELGWCLLAGAALAAHFATWVTSLSMTTVASTTVPKAPQVSLAADPVGRCRPRRP